MIQIFASTPHERNRKILIGYYGWEDGRGHTLAEIGADHGMTRERTRLSIHWRCKFRSCRSCSPKPRFSRCSSRLRHWRRGSGSSSAKCSVGEMIGLLSNREIAFQHCSYCQAKIPDGLIGQWKMLNWKIIDKIAEFEKYLNE